MRTERARLTDQLDTLCREIIRERDDNRCQKCNKIIRGSDSHPSHVVAKGNGASWRRFALWNIKLMCTHCHQWWHLHPTESGKWFSEKWPQRDSYLEIYRGGKPAKITTAEMRALVVILKDKLAELRKETL